MLEAFIRVLQDFSVKDAFFFSCYLVKKYTVSSNHNSLFSPASEP